MVMKQINTEVIQLNAGRASITVREGIGMDVIDCQLVFSALTYDRQSPRERERAAQFVEAFLRSTVSGDLGIGVEWPELHSWRVDDFDAFPKQLQAAFEGWQTLPGLDLVTWVAALKRVNRHEKTTEPAQKSTTRAKAK